MDVNLKKERLKSIIEKLVNSHYELDKLYIDWGTYDCGMGICCDITYLSLNSESYIHGFHEGMVFKLCRKEYFRNRRSRSYEDMPEICGNPPEDYREDYPILMVEDEELENDLYGTFSDVWEPYLIEIINKKYGTKIKEVVRNHVW